MAKSRAARLRNDVRTSTMTFAYRIEDDGTIINTRTGKTMTKEQVSEMINATRYAKQRQRRRHSADRKQNQLKKIQAEIARIQKQLATL